MPTSDTKRQQQAEQRRGVRPAADSYEEKNRYRRTDTGELRFLDGPSYDSVRSSRKHTCSVTFLSRGFLWDHVRVMGGAYGLLDVGQQRVPPFGSYRDPNILDTLNIYQESPTFLRDLVKEDFAREQIEQSIIGTVGDMDSPMTPSMNVNRLLWYLSGRVPRQDKI